MNNNNNNEEGTGQQDDTKFTYQMIKKMIEDMDGSCSSTVHKKVHYVIATTTAVDNVTQRIRKAIKWNIPIVSVDYIVDIYEKKTTSDNISSYLFSNEMIQERLRVYQDNLVDKCVDQDDNNNNNNKEEEKEKKRKKSSSTSQEVMTCITYDCSCICHDRGEKSCSWCVSAHDNNNNNTSANEVIEDGEEDDKEDNNDERKMKKRVKLNEFDNKKEKKEKKKNKKNKKEKKKVID